MASFGTSKSETVAGRAYVVPTGTKSRFGSENNLSANGMVSSDIHLVTTSVSDGQPFPTEMQKIVMQLPNWVLYVLHDAGTNYELAAKLPDRIELPVEIDVVTRKISSLDLDATIAELSPYKEAAVDDWKHSASVLAPVRNAIKLPGMARKGAKGLLSGLRSVVEDVKAIGQSEGTPPKPAWSDKDVEAMRRQANVLAFRYQKHPEEKTVARNAALTSLPMHVQQMQAGTIHPATFEALVMREETSTAITPEEAAQFRRDAGLTGGAG